MGRESLGAQRSDDQERDHDMANASDQTHRLHSLEKEFGGTTSTESLENLADRKEKLAGIIHDLTIQLNRSWEINTKTGAISNFISTEAIKRIQDAVELELATIQ